MSADRPTFRELIASDYARWNADGRFSWVRFVLALPLHPGLLASLFLRAQQACMRRGQVRLAWMLRTPCSALTGADFVPGCEVGRGAHFTHPVGVVLGSGVTIGDGATFASGVVLGVRSVSPNAGDGGYATVGDDVFFGAHATVLGAVKVGDGAVVGANSVVRSDVEPATIVSGIPAEVVGTTSPTADPADQ